MDQRDIVDLARNLLECARLELVAQTNTSWDGRVCMNPWSTPTRDDCCKGQLQGTITRYFPSSTFPLEDFERPPCEAGYMAADITISILDCFVGMGPKGQPRTCDALDDATDRVTIQSAAVWRGVVCCLADMDIEWIVRGQNPISNEEGGCIGSDMTLTIGMPTGCECG